MAVSQASYADYAEIILQATTYSLWNLELHPSRVFPDSLLILSTTTIT